MYLHRVMKQQWLKASELEEIQQKMLRGIIKHAYDNVPLYHQKFRSVGVMPDDIKTVRDLEKIPITTKQELRDKFPDSVIARGVDINKCWNTRTSGSTGVPLTVVWDKRAEDYEKAIALRPNLSCGQKVRDKWVVITSQDHIVTKKWFQKLRIFAPEYMSLFDEVKKQISILEKFSPDILDGYSSSLYLLAKEIKETGNSKIHPRIIFSTSELLDEETRRYIKSVFGVEVYDQFGCVELARTAWECPEHCGYHIDIDAVVMEFLRDGDAVASGERGEIVYTGLYNYSMPLIRYAVGDIGIPSDEKCPCGRGLPLMEVVEGRKDAFVQVPGGKIYSPIIWTILLRPFPEIAQFKVIQERKDLIIVQIIRDENFSQETVNRVKKSINTVLGEDVYIEVEIVDNIPREGGKVRSAVSKVRIEW
ncbi:phenylacetate-CoA ligase [Candidatus Methanophagaceae archaeon]|nr:phenylacetate-CoA ligase [Methanophagales archaeon]